MVSNARAGSSGSVTCTPACDSTSACWHWLRIAINPAIWHTRSSLRPDAGCFHDWPPFLDLGFLQRAERFGRLLLGWRKLRPPRSAKAARTAPRVSGSTRATLMKRSPNQEIRRPICDSDLRIGYGANQAVLRDGANPTATRATSFRDLISTTDTSFVCGLAT